MRLDTILENDRFLIGRICEGDAAAMEQLFARHATPVYSVAMRILHLREPAEDVLHEVFMQLWREPKSFRGPDLNLAGSLVLLARNRAIDCLLNRIVREYDVPPVHKTTRNSPLPVMLSTVCALGNLRSSRVQQSGLHMAFFEGKTVGVIAKELGETPKTVKTRIKRELEQVIGISSSHPGADSDA
jgi:RNA polymerase sigma-70 factor (ECF subfamily)